MNETRALQKRLATHGTGLGALLLASGFLVGCAAEVAEGEPTASADMPVLPARIAESRRARGMGLDAPFTAKQRTQVLNTLQTSGYRIDDAVFFADNAVIIEGDLLFDGPTVLKDATSVRKKGYWFGSGNFPGFVSYEEIVNVTGTFPDWDWEVAFYAAAGDFATLTNVQLQGGYDPQYSSTIEVDVFGYPSNYNGLLALSEAGHDKVDPGRIWINTNYNGLSGPSGPCHVSSTYALPYAVKFHVATHEMMHAIGFAHVGDGSHVDWTAWSGTNYDSCMYAGSCLNEQTYYTTGLSTDDVDSINNTYWLEGRQKQ